MITQELIPTLPVSGQIIREKRKAYSLGGHAPLHWLLVTSGFFGMMILAGCSGTRQSAIRRDTFFKPVKSRAVVVVPSATKSEVDSLRVQVRRLERKLATSLAVATPAPDTMSRQLLATLEISNRLLANRVFDLEYRLTTMAAQQQRSSLQDSLVHQNTALLGLVGELQQKIGRMESDGRRLASGAPSPVRREPSPVEPSSGVSNAAVRLSIRDGYSSALDLFNQRNYAEAEEEFRTLVERGIDEDLADNCEYWIGESHFARGEYHKATDAFLRVIAMPGSNKNADAYLMMGRSYEFLNEYQKARAAFENVVRSFPQSSAAATARLKLQQGKYRTKAKTDRSIT